MTESRLPDGLFVVGFPMIALMMGVAVVSGADVFQVLVLFSFFLVPFFLLGDSTNEELRSRGSLRDFRRGYSLSHYYSNAVAVFIASVGLTHLIESWLPLSSLQLALVAAGVHWIVALGVRPVLLNSMRLEPYRGVEELKAQLFWSISGILLFATAAAIPSTLSIAVGGASIFGVYVFTVLASRGAQSPSPPAGFARQRTA